MQNQVEIVGHSVDPRGNELLSVLVTFPRIILAEVNTHRMLSKNTSSSRAIPFNKMVEAVEKNPFIPFAFQKHHSGMQGTEYLTGEKANDARIAWLDARRKAVNEAYNLHKNIGVTKQLCNRLLEPFMWTTMLITGPVKGGWDNFFNLRCPQYEWEEYNEPYGFSYKKSKKEYLKELSANDTTHPKTHLEWLKINKGQGEIHIMDLAEKIYDALNESIPKKLKPGEYHIPFENKITGPFIYEADGKKWVFSKDMLENEVAANEIIINGKTVKSIILNQMVKISTSMAARTSYTLIEGTETSNEKHLDLYHKLIHQNPPHSSPMEHVGLCMNDDEYFTFIKGERAIDMDYESGKYYAELVDIEDDVDAGWCRNFKGFIPLRHLVETEVRKFN